jgi:hypothetical protein
MAVSPQSSLDGALEGSVYVEYLLSRDYIANITRDRSSPGRIVEMSKRSSDEFLGGT